MKKRIFLALIILIAFMSVGIISASEISVNDTYVAQDSSENLLAVDEGGVGSNSSNILSIDNVDTNLDENTIGDDFTNYDEIKASDLTLYYKNGTRLTAQLVDRFGNGQADQPLTFYISGVEYERTTDSQGYASIAINLSPGNYVVGIYYHNQKYAEKSVNCTVLPTISGDDIVKYYKNDTQYYATFLKGDGTPLADTDVTFNINGVFYTRTTNASGVARLNINLPPQDQGYILTAIHPETGYMYSNNVTVRPTISSKDLYKVYKDNNQYYATFLTGEGNPLANADVTFNINGVFYTRTTNASGVARLNINLLAGEYILTAIHPNDTYMLSNMVHIIGSSDTYLAGKDYIYNIDDKQIIEVQLFNEYYYGVPNQGIDIIAEGLTDTATTTAMTNDAGIANVTLDLSPGEYIVHYTYLGDDAGTYKASTATSALTIKEGKPVHYDEGISTLYYGMGEKFNITITDEYDVPIVGAPVYFRIGDNGKLYERITDENGTAGLTITMNSGVYTMNYKFNATGYERINDACPLLVIDGPTSTLEGIDWEKYYGSDEKFRVYLNVNKIGLPGRDVIFNINGVNYTRTTDDDGNAAIAINLLPGKYPVKYYYLGEDRIEPSSGECYVTVKERIATSLDWESLINYSDGRNINLQVLLKDKVNNKAIASKEVIFTIGTNTYTATTDAGGIASIFVSVTGGPHGVSYEFMGDDTYAPSSGYTLISVSDSSEGYGYWVFGRDMYNVDLTNLAAGGTTDILLNYYAFTVHGEANVLNWIAEANSKGIRVHIWMQVFYSGGSWVNPVSGGSVNQAYFNSVIDEAKYYAGLNGVSGVHFDYLRYPGDAYQTSGGTAAITEFVRQACDACKAINPNIIMSAAVMPETTNDIYYYGQDIPAISQYLDVIIPMQYKGNYNSGTGWLASTTQWFVANSNGASVWSGLQAYVSDDNTATLSYVDLYNDAQTVLKSGAGGVILFRYGLSELLKFADLDGYSGDDPVVNKDTVSISSIVNGASYVADYYLANLDYPEYVSLAEGRYTIPQFLYLMSKAIVQINDGNLNPVSMVSMNDPSNSGDIIDGDLTKAEYIDVFNRVANFIINNGIVPAYASSNTLGKIAYVELVDSSSRILNYYNNNGQLPSTVHIVYKASSSSKSISELSQSLIKGLTTERAKATALYNYVRDEISYEFYYDTQKGAEGTLTSGGGNCCDQAQLLVAMARSVGLTARFDTGYCYFTLSGSSYGHVWAQILVDGVWVNADPTSTRNSFGEIVNWNTASYTDRGTYDVLPY